MPRLTHNSRILWLLLLAALCAGCKRAHFRIAADNDAYGLTSQSTELTRAAGRVYPIDVDQASRMYDPFDPDHETMPPDDPAAHTYMHWVDNMNVWK